MENKGFKSRAGFIMAAAGSAVGLGNLWAFPFKTGQNGGALFVIIYVVMAIIVGFVGMLSEMYIGKRTGKNIVDSYKKVNKNLTWIGALGVLTTTIIASYYIVLGGWVLKYTYSYLVGAKLSVNGDYKGYFDAFSGSSWEPILFMGIFFLIAMLILTFGVQKGIERISKILMPMLLILMIILVIKSLTLGKGVKEGIEFYLKPNFKDFKPSFILAAMGQAFFSLSLGCGTMCVYGSYAKNHKGLAKSAMMVISLDTIIAIIAGFMIFPVVFAYNQKPNAGPALFFNTLPVIFNSMKAGRFFGFLFFFLVFIAAITSIISMVEVSLQTTIEKTKIKRPYAILIFTVIIFTLGSFISLSQGNKHLKINGSDLLTFFDTVISQYMMPFGTIIACISVGWFINKKELYDDFSDFKLKKTWVFFTKFITPIFVSLILFFGIFSFSKKGFNFANDYRTFLTASIIILLFSMTNLILVKINKKKELNKIREKNEEINN